MTTLMDVYNKHKSTVIKPLVSRGFKVFLTDESYYFDSNIDRLREQIVSYNFDVPFGLVALISPIDITFISKDKDRSDADEFYGSIMYKMLEYECNGKIHIRRNKSDGEDFEKCTYNEKDNTIVYVKIISYKETQTEIILALTLTKSNYPMASEFIHPETEVYGNSIMSWVINGIDNIIAYFYELIGEDFEVKVIDQPKVKDKKGGKKRKPQGPPLFTIMRRPRTTVTVDLSAPTQERPKSNEPVVPRGPLEYGHNRRPHTRTFRHPRYVNVLGKTIEVRGTRVGPEKERETVYLVAKSKGE